MSLLDREAAERFEEQFPDERACADYLFDLRWPRGFQCSRCEHEGAPYKLSTRPHVLKCRSCRAETSLTAGTVMERSRIPLRDWFFGALALLASPRGISALELQRILSLARYETAYLMHHRLRAAMVPVDEELLGQEGPVSLRTMRFGGATIALALEQFDGDGSLLKARALRDDSVEALEDFVAAYLTPDAVVCADDERVLVIAEHLGHSTRLMGAGDEARDLASQMSRWLKSRSRGASQKHLQAALNEYAFRFSHQGDLEEGFRTLLGIGTTRIGPTADDLYSGRWVHPNRLKGFPIRSSF